jgi:CDP-2,3-bis-(O-geranylgeranyl)-sn-glycerol synthase
MGFLFVFLPVLGAAITHGPVLKWGLFPWLAKPLDLGLTFRGRRLFGDNKTFRGLVVMFAGAFGLALLLSRIPAYWAILPDDIRRAGVLPFAFLVGIGTPLAELPNSFLKRQLGIAPGTQQKWWVSVIDQGDFVFGISLLLLPIWRISLLQLVIAFAVVSAVHLLVSVIGYAIGARKTVL